MNQEQEQNLEKLKWVEVGNFPEKQFRIMILKLIQDLEKKNGGKSWEHAEVFYLGPRRTKEQTKINI